MFGSSKIETRTRWEGPDLVQELKGGRTTLMKTLRTTTEGRQLVVTVRLDEDRSGGPPISLKLVYDRE